MKDILKRTVATLLLLAFACVLLPQTVQAAALAAPRITSVGIETTTSMLVQWGKVQGATGYEVYRASGGKYAKVATVDTNAYTDKGVRKNKTYAYKIRAVSGGATGAYSKAASMKVSTARPPLTAKAAGASEVRLTWKKVKGAAGYQVLTSTSKATGFKGAAVGKRLAYTRGGLATGARHFFKVRTFAKRGGVAYYGLPSVVKSATPALPKGTQTTANSLVRLVNAERKKAGRSTLITDPVLTTMARKRAEECARQFSHWRPDGKYYDSIADEYGYTGTIQNEALAFTAYQFHGPPERVMRTWKASPNHWAAIMGRDHEYVAAGYCEKGNYRYYVLLFATDE